MCERNSQREQCESQKERKRMRFVLVTWIVLIDTLIIIVRLNMCWLIDMSRLITMFNITNKMTCLVDLSIHTIQIGLPSSLSAYRALLCFPLWPWSTLTTEKEERKRERMFAVSRLNLRVSEYVRVCVSMFHWDILASIDDHHCKWCRHSRHRVHLHGLWLLLSYITDPYKWTSTPLTQSD